jgi:autotransporter-associated beta strand protein
LNGLVSGSGSLSKFGAGALLVSGNNTYSGSTTLFEGTLLGGNDHAFGSGEIVLKGGVLQLQSGVNIANSITLAGGSFARQLAAGTSLATLGGFKGDVTGTIVTNANLLGGSTSGTSSIQTSFAASSPATNDAGRLSSVFSISGVPVVDLASGATDTFVLQLAIPNVTASSYLAWYQPSTMQWVNSVAGNFGGTNLFSGDHAYRAATDFHLGTWGIDSASGSVWAVLNHNSDFSVFEIIAVPEPSAWGAGMGAALAGLAFLRSRRRRK